jgi:hypothetical protein
MRGRALPAWSAPALVAVACFSFYLALWPHVSERLDPLTGDEPFYVMTAISLIEDQDLDESNNYRAELVIGESGPYILYAFDDQLNPTDPLPANWNGWPSPPRLVGAHAATTERTGLYTKHGIGLSGLIAVPWAIGGRLGANLIVMAAAALLAAQMFLLARESGAGAWLAAALAGGIAIAMPVGPYALLLFPEVPAALLLVYAIRRAAAPSNAWWQWLLTGIAAGYLPWLHQRFAPTAVVLSAFLLARILRQRDVLLTATLTLAPIAVGGFALLNYNLWLYGQPLQRTEDHAGFNGLIGTLNGGFGLLLDAQWGLLIAAPVMLLALAAFPRWYVECRPLARVALAAALPYLIVVAAYKVWWGEWGPAGRYLVPVVPLAAGPLAAWLRQASVRGLLVAYGLWGAGMLLTIVGYRDPQRFYHHPDGVNQLVTILGDRFDVDMQRFLVAFQFYSTAPLPARFWIAAAMLAFLVLATRSISASALRTLSGGGLNSLRKNLGLH